MAKQAIKIIKKNQKLITVTVDVPKVRELNETELMGKRVVTVGNWISERRDNETGELSDSRQKIFEWRSLDKAKRTTKVKKFAIVALTE
jgi:hypothetical protein